MNKEIHTYLKLITRWWWLLVISAIIPMVISYHFASQQPDLYQAKATLVVGTSIFQDPDPNRSEMDLSNTLAAAYAELVRQRPVTEAVIERLGLERAPEALAGQIGTSIRSGAQLLEIQVIDTNPQAAALIANALADELIRRSPSSGQDPEQQDFIKNQLNELQIKVENINKQIEELSASLADLTSAAEIQDTQERIDALEEVKSRYQSTYADLFDSYHAESPNVLSLFEPASIPQWPIPSKTKLINDFHSVGGLKVRHLNMHKRLQLTPWSKCGFLNWSLLVEIGDQTRRPPNVRSPSDPMAERAVAPERVEPVAQWMSDSCIGTLVPGGTPASLSNRPSPAAARVEGSLPLPGGLADALAHPHRATVVDPLWAVGGSPVAEPASTADLDIADLAFGRGALPGVWSFEPTIPSAS